MPCVRLLLGGCAQVMYTVPMGGFDAKKHATVADCVRAELSEEVRSEEVPLSAKPPAPAKSSPCLNVAAPHTRTVRCSSPRAFEPQAMLCGGELVQLPYAGHPGFAEVKWCANRVHVFVAIDPQARLLTWALGVQLGRLLGGHALCGELCSLQRWPRASVRCLH